MDFESVATGKLRRYFDWQNFVDVFKLPLGLLQAWFKLGRLKPDLVFSKGGFVAVPVVLAAWLRRIPVFIHESDAIPGLATRICAPFARRIFLGFEEVARELPRWQKKLAFVGNPVRAEILDGDAKRAQEWAQFKAEKPVLLVMGGSSGAQQINELVEAEFEAISEHFNLIHVKGPGHAEKRLKGRYVAVPYLYEELKDVYALADACMSRAGAGAVAELEALSLPSLLYPLGRAGSRGDQVANAQMLSMRDKNFIMADESRSALEQLLELPKRGKAKGNDAVAKITEQILVFKA